jgi:hypothetical protein
LICRVPGLSNPPDDEKQQSQGVANLKDSVPIGPITGGVIAIFIILLLSFLAFFAHRRRQKALIQSDPYEFRFNPSHERSYFDTHISVPGHTESSLSHATTISWRAAPNPSLWSPDFLTQNSSTRSDTSRSGRRQATLSTQSNNTSLRSTSRYTLRKELGELRIKPQITSIRESIPRTSS